MYCIDNWLVNCHSNILDCQKFILDYILIHCTVMTSKYKLYYFNDRWAAEPTRLVFAAAGVPYEDIRLSEDSWPSRKSGLPASIW